jgi:hypothetical protein
MGDIRRLRRTRNTRRRSLEGNMKDLGCRLRREELKNR